jgi:hypothetical protein
MFNNVSLRRVDNGDTSTYKVSSSTPLVKVKVKSVCDPLKHASAPPAPWYYYSYPMEVIAKAHTVLHETWYKLNYTYQKLFLEFYLRRYNNNDLE